MLDLKRLLLIVASCCAMNVSASDFADYTGQQLYQRFCASCHGASGRGDGPVADYFSHHVPDLTRIAERHGGRYPSSHVTKIIDGRSFLAAHGTRTMPVWGTVFGENLAPGDSEMVISRLTDYVQSLQHSQSTRDVQVPPTHQRDPETPDKTP